MQDKSTKDWRTAKSRPIRITRPGQRNRHGLRREAKRPTAFGEPTTPANHNARGATVGVAVLEIVQGESSRGLEHSKTLRAGRVPSVEDARPGMHV